MIQKKRKIKVAFNKELSAEAEKIHYMDVATLSKFISDRGRILNRDKTGVSAKGQRRLAQQVKRARHLAILPFVTGV